MLSKYGEAKAKQIYTNVYGDEIFSKWDQFEKDSNGEPTIDSIDAYFLLKSAPINTPLNVFNKALEKIKHGKFQSLSSSLVSQLEIKSNEIKKETRNVYIKKSVVEAKIKIIESFKQLHGIYFDKAFPENLDLNFYKDFISEKLDRNIDEIGLGTIEDTDEFRHLMEFMDVAKSYNEVLKDLTLLEATLDKLIEIENQKNPKDKENNNKINDGLKKQNAEINSFMTKQLQIQKIMAETYSIRLGEYHKVLSKKSNIFTFDFQKGWVIVDKFKPLPGLIWRHISNAKKQNVAIQLTAKLSEVIRENISVSVFNFKSTLDGFYKSFRKAGYKDTDIIATIDKLKGNFAKSKLFTTLNEGLQKNILNASGMYLQSSIACDFLQFTLNTDNETYKKLHSGPNSAVDKVFISRELYDSIKAYVFSDVGKQKFRNPAKIIERFEPLVDPTFKNVNNIDEAREMMIQNVENMEAFLAIQATNERLISDLNSDIMNNKIYGLSQIDRLLFFIETMNDPTLHPMFDEQFRSTSESLQKKGLIKFKYKDQIPGLDGEMINIKNTEYISDYIDYLKNAEIKRTEQGSYFVKAQKNHKIGAKVEYLTFVSLEMGIIWANSQNPLDIPHHTYIYEMAKTLKEEYNNPSDYFLRIFPEQAKDFIKSFYKLDRSKLREGLDLAKGNNQTVYFPRQLGNIGGSDKSQALYTIILRAKTNHEAYLEKQKLVPVYNAAQTILEDTYTDESVLRKEIDLLTFYQQADLYGSSKKYQRRGNPDFTKNVDKVFDETDRYNDKKFYPQWKQIVEELKEALATNSTSKINEANEKLKQLKLEIFNSFSKNRQQEKQITKIQKSIESILNSNRFTEDEKIYMVRHLEDEMLNIGEKTHPDAILDSLATMSRLTGLGFSLVTATMDFFQGLMTLARLAMSGEFFTWRDLLNLNNTRFKHLDKTFNPIFRFFDFEHVGNGINQRFQTKMGYLFEALNLDNNIDKIIYGLGDPDKTIVGRIRDKFDLYIFQEIVSKFYGQTILLTLLNKQDLNIDDVLIKDEETNEYIVNPMYKDKLTQIALEYRIIMEKISGNMDRNRPIYLNMTAFFRSIGVFKSWIFQWISLGFEDYFDITTGEERKSSMSVMMGLFSKDFSNHLKNIFILMTGKDKNDMVKDLFNEQSYKDFASYVIVSLIFTVFTHMLPSWGDDEEEDSEAWEDLNRWEKLMYNLTSKLKGEVASMAFLPISVATLFYDKKPLNAGIIAAATKADSGISYVYKIFNFLADVKDAIVETETDPYLMRSMVVETDDDNNDTFRYRFVNSFLSLIPGASGIERFRRNTNIAVSENPVLN